MNSRIAWILPLAAALLLALPVVGFTQAGPGASLAKQGNALKAKKQYADAILKYQEAINAEKTNYRYHLLKGDCEVKLKKYNEAITSYRSAAGLAREVPTVYAKLGQAFVKKKEYPGAIQAFNSAYDYEKDPGKKLTYKLFSVKLLTKVPKPQEAMAELNKLKPTYSNDVRVLSAEGDIYGAMNNWAAAVASHEKALNSLGATESNRDKFVYNLALAYQKAGNTAKSKELAATLKNARYQALYRRNAGASGATQPVRIARGYLRANQLEDATEWAQKAIQADPNSPLGYQTMATILIRKGQNQPAIGLLRRAAEMEKDEARRAKIQSSMLKLQFNAGDYRGALESSNAILAKTPNNATVLGLKAQAEYQLGQFANAIATSEKAVIAMKEPSKASAFYFTQGLAARKAGDLEKAKTAFKEAEKSSTFRAAARNEASKIAAR
jgi:tetratricopeptide (TPR) repeat protein